MNSISVTSRNPIGSVFQNVPGGIHIAIMLCAADPQAHFPDRSQPHRLDVGASGDHKTYVLAEYHPQILSDRGMRSAGCACAKRLNREEAVAGPSC